MREAYATATFALRVTITIPANGSNTSSLKTLISQGTAATTVSPVILAGYQIPNGIDQTSASLISSTDFLSRIVGIKVHKYQPGTTTGAQRSAMLIASGPSDATNCEYVATGEDYYEPANRDGDGSYPMAASGGSFTALAVCYIVGSAGG